MAAAASNQKAYHYTDKPITNWNVINVSNVKSQYKIGSKGKPIGFWYAYGSGWKNILKNTSKSSYGYAFDLPEESFITISDKPDTTKILRLTTIDELKDFFELTGVAIFMKTPEEIEEEQGYEAATSGNIDVDMTSIKWVDYWESISEMYGGIEFSGELIRPRSEELTDENFIEEEATGEQIDISWLRMLDIPSGVIFDPKRFFGGAPPSTLLQAGGKHRRTIRNRNRTRRRTLRRKL